MRRILTTFAVLSLSFTFSAQAAESERGDGWTEWATYESKPFQGTAYTIDYPAHWELNEVSPALVAFVSPEGHWANVTVSVQDLRREGQETPTLEAYMEGYDDRLAKSYLKYERLERKADTLSGLPSSVTRYSAVDRVDPKWQLEVHAHTAINSAGHLIEAAYTSTPKLHDQFIEDANETIRSFKLKSA